MELNSIKLKLWQFTSGHGKQKQPEFNEISWTNTYVKTLGINHGYHIPEHEVWMQKIKKMKNCILSGKVVI